MVAIFNLGGGEVVLILTLILILFGARTLPPMIDGLKAGIEQFRGSHGQSGYEPQFDRNLLIDGITILLLIVLSFAVLACLRS